MTSQGEEFAAAMAEGLKANEALIVEARAAIAALVAEMEEEMPRVIAAIDRALAELDEDD